MIDLSPVFDLLIGGMRVIGYLLIVYWFYATLYAAAHILAVLREIRDLLKEKAE